METNSLASLPFSLRRKYHFQATAMVSWMASSRLPGQRRCLKRIWAWVSMRGRMASKRACRWATEAQGASGIVDPMGVLMGTVLMEMDRPRRTGGDPVCG